MQTLVLYCARNPLFALSFIFSRLPLWVLMLAFTLGHIDGISTVLTAILVLTARGYIEMDISVDKNSYRFFRAAVVRPVMTIFGLVLFIVCYPFLLFFLATEDIYVQTGLIVLLILTAYLYLSARQESFGKNVFGVYGLEKPSESFLLSILIVFIWLYVLISGDSIFFILSAIFIIFILELYRFVRKYEGII